MQIRIKCAISEIHNFPSDLVAKLCKHLSYINKSMSYSIKKFTKNKHRVLFALMNRHHLNSIEEAKIFYDEELSRLHKLQHVSLVKVNPDGVVVIPTGLLVKFHEFLDEHIVDKKNVYTVDLRVKPAKPLGFPVSLAPMELYPFQKIAVQACLDKCQGVIESATGSGKTLVIQEVIKKLGLKALVVVPTLSILNQTVKRFTEYFGSKRVGKYTSSTTKIRDIMVGCAPSVSKSDKAIWADRDVLCFDEAHHCPCKTIEKISYEVVPDAFYRFGFSATSYRADGADLAIEAAVFPKIFSYDINQAIKDGFLADPTFIMFNINASTGIYGGEDTLKAYKSHVLYNQYLNAAVIKQTNQFIAEGKRVLIMVREKEHGNVLQSGIPGSVFVRTKEAKIDDSYTAPTMDTDRAIQAFNARKISCLLGTSIIGEGTDILPVDVVIMLTSVASKVAVMQNIGRGLRKCEGKTGVMIIDYIFNVHPALQRHSKRRFMYYQSIKKVNTLTLDKEGNIEEFKKKA